MREIACLADAHALPHLCHAHEIALVDVAGGPGRHVELEGLVAGIRERLADVVRHARRARDRPDQPVGHGVGRCEHADPARPLQPDLILGQQVFELD